MCECGHEAEKHRDHGGHCVACLCDHYHQPIKAFTQGELDAAVAKADYKNAIGDLARLLHQQTQQVEAATNRADCITVERNELIDDVERLRTEKRLLHAEYSRIAEERDQARRFFEAYKRAKAENDERFMCERDQARQERDQAVAKAEEYRLHWVKMYNDYFKAQEQTFETTRIHCMELAAHAHNFHSDAIDEIAKLKFSDLPTSSLKADLIEPLNPDIKAGK